MERDATYEDLIDLEEIELREYAKAMDLPVGKDITKDQLVRMLLGEKCFGCGKK